MSNEKLKLENQICFPVYAASRLIIREYQPHLQELGITYPQYLVLLVLWEVDGLPVNDIAKKLVLNTNTITPLLKRMEQLGLISRRRSDQDERKVIVNLTSEGELLKEKASRIPEKLSEQLLDTDFEIEDLIQLKMGLESIISSLTRK